MSDIKNASGGDGWSQWNVTRTPTGGYEVLVVSSAESTQSGSPKVLLDTEVLIGGKAAIDEAIRVSNEYAYRMFT